MSRSIIKALWMVGICSVVGVTTTAQAEIKRSIAIAPVDWKAPQVNWTSDGAIEAQLITALKESGRYRVVERLDLNAMMGEQAISGGGLRALKGAQMLIKAVVTEAAVDSGNSRTIRFGGVGGSKDNEVFRVTMNMRIYDVQTGDILDTVTVTGEQETKSRSRGGSFGNWDIEKGKTEGDTTGAVTEDLIKRAIEALDHKAYDVRWSSTIKTISGGKAVMMGGKRDGVEQGMTFDLYQLGEAIVDEDTGEILDGGEEVLVGKLKAVQVKDKITFLGKVSGATPKKGNVVKLIEKKKAPPPAPQAAAEPDQSSTADSGGKSKRKRR